MIEFDEWWSDGDEGGQQDATDFPWPNDGEHAGEIVRVRDEKLQFMERHGADGRCLAIDVQIPKARRLEALVSVTWRGKIGEICRAARVHQPAKGEPWDEQQLVGRQVVVETVLGIAKSGREYCRIERWVAMPDPLPKVETRPAPPAAVTAAKRKPAQAVEDDIPF